MTAGDRRTRTKVRHRSGPKVTWTIYLVSSSTRRRLDEIATATNASLGLLVQEIIRHANLDPATGQVLLPQSSLMNVSDAAHEGEDVVRITVQTEDEIKDRFTAIANASGCARQRGRALNLLVSAVDVDRLTGRPVWWPEVLRDLGYITDDTAKELPLNLAS